MRRVTADELVLAMEKLGVSLEYFTDPFRLVGEGRFSWRQIDARAENLVEYEHKAGRWIAAYRALAPKVGRETPFMRRALRLTRQSRIEDAMRAGERFVAEFGLGHMPATGLIDVMERKLGILALMVDFSDGISSAACRLPELDAVIVARREVEGRRNLELAHGLFHTLTWDAMPPAQSEEALGTGGNRVEQLANSFAAALLMPSESLDGYGDWKSLGQENLVDRLNSAAQDLRVTSSALCWRLVTLGQLKPAMAHSLPDTALRNNGRDVATDTLPSLYSRQFVEVFALAINTGCISLRRAANLLDLTLDDLSDLLASHGVGPPAEL